jgi:hypothetical protein
LVVVDSFILQVIRSASISSWKDLAPTLTFISKRDSTGVSEFLCTSEVLNLSVLDIHGILYNCCMHLGSAGFFHFEADSGFQDFLHSRSRR